MSIEQRKYVDIDLNFCPHPVTGDVVRLVDERAINQSIKNLVLSHTDILSLLFEQPSLMLSQSIKKTIENVLIENETRIIIKNILVTLVQDEYTIRIIYNIRNNINPVTVEVFLRRLR